MAIFRKVADVSGHAELNGTHKDLYASKGGMIGRTFSVDGAGAAAHTSDGYSSIKAGLETNKSIMTATLNDLPAYGDAKLHSLDFRLKVEDILIGNMLTAAPEVALFKLKDNIPDYGSSGESRKVLSTGKPAGHVTAMTSNADGFVSDEEDFSGALNSHKYRNQTTYIPQPRGLLVGHKPYLSRQDGWDYARAEATVGAKLVKDHDGQDIDSYSKAHTEYIDSATGKQCMIKQVAGTHSPKFWTTTKNGNDHTPNYYSHDDIATLINYGKSEVLDAEEDYNNQVTPNNSFFSVVKQDRELMLEPESADPILIGAGVSRFNSKNTFGDSGQSMEMYCHWAGDNRFDDADSGAGVEENIQKLKQLYRPVTSPGGNYHSAQETFASYGTVPFPTKIFPSATRDIHGSGNHNTMDPYRSTIEIDFNLDELEAAVKFDANASSDGRISMTKRAFVITMGYYKPSTSDTLTAYIDKHMGDLAEGNETDAEDGLPFWGWSFVNVQESNEGMFTNGIKVIPSIVWKRDKTAVSGEIAKGYDYYIDEDRTDHYGGTSGKYTGGVNYFDPTASVPDKSWITFKMMLTPYWGTGTPGTKAIEWGLFNAGDHTPIVWDQYSNHMTGDASNSTVAYGSNAVKANKDSNLPEFGGARTYLPEDLNFSNSYRKFASKKCRFDLPAGYLPHYHLDGIDANGMDYWQNDTDYLGNVGSAPLSSAAIWPRYLTIWLTNYPNTTSTSNADTFLEDFGGEQAVTIGGNTEQIRRATQSKTFVGGIRLKDFNYRHSNGTVSSSVTGWRNKLSIGGGTCSTNGLTDDIYPKQKFPGYSVLSFGTDTQTDFQRTDREQLILLSNYHGNLAQNTAPYKIHGSISANYHADLASNEEAETYFGNAFTEVNLHGATDGDACFTIEPGVTQDSGLVDLTGTNLCENFTQKGGIRINDLTSAAKRTDSSPEEPNLVKREHHGCAAKILKAVNVNEGVYQVDTTEIFRNGESDTYIAYLYGGGYRGTGSTPATTNTSGKDGNVYRNDIKLVEVLDDKHVKLEWNGKTSATDDLMVSEERIAYLWISPYKHWLYFTITPYDYDADEGIKTIAPRSYGSAVLLTEQVASETALAQPYGVVGATHNEYLYQDTPSVSGAYENRWYHEQEKRDTIIDNQDFGFGEWSEDEDGGWMTSKIAKPNTTLKFNMDTVVDVSGLEPGDEFNFMLAPKYHESVFEAVYRNPEFAHTAQGPVLYTNFEDELPKAPELSVSPNQEDPMFPEFKITNSASDLWYQLLLIDTQPINSQYNGGILHMPFNESGQHGVHPSSVPKNLLFNNNGDTGTTSNTANITDANVLHDAEGLAGNCLRFDGSGDNVEYNPSSGNTFTDITSEYSMIAHIIPDTDASGDDTFIGTFPVTVLYNATNKKIEAQFYSSTGTDAGSALIELTSPALQIDGETPICVIVTFDRYIKAGNCKLYIDGVLVDQSGLATSTEMDNATNATNNNWCTADNAFVSTSAFTIGNNFKGRMEEVVVYNKVIYPLPANADKFTLTKPLTDIENGSAIGYTARLFTKDYHNIRGSTRQEVACSSQVSWRKAGFRLHD